MNILITGSSGYIGGQLALYLAGQGHKVTALMREAGALKSTPRLRSVVDPNYHNVDWEGAAVFKDQDVVIHTAGRVHRKAKNGDKVTEEYRQDNVELTLRFAEMAQRAGVKRYLFLSSIGAQLLENTFHEGRITSKAAWRDLPYRMSKLEAERQLQVFGKKNSLGICSLRMPMVYGANAPGSFSTLIRIIRRGIPLPFGGFTDSRAFVSIETVKDFVSYYLAHPEADGRNWAIRDGDEISPLVFAQEAARAAHLPAPQFWSCPHWVLNLGAALVGRHQTARSLAEPVHVNLDVVAKKLGWRPRLTVAEGLEKALS